jgi:thioredoxin 1
MHGELVPSLAETHFQSFIDTSDGAVVVDFWAPWCGPCRAMAPLLERLAVTSGGKVQVRKVNIDEAPGLAAEFGVRSIPTLVLFKDGQPLSQLVGLQTAQQLSTWVSGAL